RPRVCLRSRSAAERRPPPTRRVSWRPAAWRPLCGGSGLVAESWASFREVRGVRPCCPCTCAVREPPGVSRSCGTSLTLSSRRTTRARMHDTMEPTRDRAWETLTRYTKSESLLRHALAVEASTAAYARKFGEDEELWRVAALLHDFDYEMHPTLDLHPQDGAPILREEGYPEEIVETVLSHAEHLALPRDTLLKKALFACDELSGFVHACALVRPTGLEGLEPKSVKNKLKQPSFAAGVHRDEVYAGA